MNSNKFSDVNLLKEEECFFDRPGLSKLVLAKTAIHG